MTNSDLKNNKTLHQNKVFTIGRSVRHKAIVPRANVCSVRLLKQTFITFLNDYKRRKKISALLIHQTREAASSETAQFGVIWRQWQSRLWWRRCFIFSPFSEARWSIVLSLDLVETHRFLRRARTQERGESLIYAARNSHAKERTENNSSLAYASGGLTRTQWLRSLLLRIKSYQSFSLLNLVPEILPSCFRFVRLHLFIYLFYFFTNSLQTEKVLCREQFVSP